MKIEKNCINGHAFIKRSACTICPICEKNKELLNPFLSQFSAPARRAFEHAAILSLEEAMTYSKSELMGLHGVGNTTLLKLEKLALEQSAHQK